LNAQKMESNLHLENSRRPVWMQLWLFGILTILLWYLESDIIKLKFKILPLALIVSFCSQWEAYLIITKLLLGIYQKAVLNVSSLLLMKEIKNAQI